MIPCQGNVNPSQGALGFWNWGLEGAGGGDDGGFQEVFTVF